jgi:rRNA maturation endonuclease Nob1
MKKCSNCGLDVNDNQSFCPNCGNKLNLDVINNQTNENVNNQNVNQSNNVK